MEELREKVLCDKLEDKMRRGLSLVSGYDLVCDTKRFLDEYYSGCYTGGYIEYITKSVFVSAEGYANFLKIIFKSVFSSHMIHISASSTPKTLLFEIKFDTSVLNGKNCSGLSKIAKKSGFSYEISRDKVIVKFNYTNNEFSGFRSISTNIVYITLKKILKI